mmetsp:Transcript_42218/g.76505  ORF Transcript_42218/g.76505 Transcript_42218/m.76505 type:complete len:336 (+) Transcript_42218:58-1065(+)
MSGGKQAELRFCAVASICLLSNLAVCASSKAAFPNPAVSPHGRAQGTIRREHHLQDAHDEAFEDVLRAEEDHDIVDENMALLAKQEGRNPPFDYSTHRRRFNFIPQSASAAGGDPRRGVVVSHTGEIANLPSGPTTEMMGHEVNASFPRLANGEVSGDWDSSTVVTQQLHNTNYQWQDPSQSSHGGFPGGGQSGWRRRRNNWRIIHGGALGSQNASDQAVHVGAGGRNDTVPLNSSSVDANSSRQLDNVTNQSFNATLQVHDTLPVPCEWEDWSAWSDCSHSCMAADFRQPGQQWRKRDEIQGRNLGRPCQGYSVETKPCGFVLCSSIVAVNSSS